MGELELDVEFTAIGLKQNIVCRSRQLEVMALFDSPGFAPYTPGNLATCIKDG